MLLMPAFHRFQPEAEIIGRLLAGYGELELLLGLAAGVSLGDEWLGPKTIFRVRSEANRIQIADSLTRGSYEKAKLAPEYADMLGAMRHCLKIRNQFAHCHWADHYEGGLFFTNLEDAASAAKGFEYDWLHIDLALLQTHESYFMYAMECLWHLPNAFYVANGKLSSLTFPMPPKRPQPSLNNPPLEHIPPWLSEDQKRQFGERMKAKQAHGH
jgi:hypothetical protein